MPAVLRTVLSLAAVVAALALVLAASAPPVAEASDGRSAGAARAGERACNDGRRSRRSRGANRGRRHDRDARRSRGKRGRKRGCRRSPSAPQPAPPAFGQIGASEIVTPFPAGLRAFGPASVWNRPLPPDAPLDPDSRRLSTALADQVKREATRKAGPWINTSRWSVPVYTVGADVPTVRVQLDNHKPQLQRDFEAVPIPARAVSSNDTDQTLAIYQPATDSYWDFYRMHRQADGWHATYGGKMTNASSNPGYFPYRYGASASGLPLLAGLMTIGELEALRIDHALALAVPTTAAGQITWPAQRSDGRTVGPAAIPEGTHFRIDPSLDVTRLGLSPVALAMARAAQRYGIIVRDGASNVTFYAEDPTTTGRNPYPRLFGGRYPNEVLRGFPWGRLQVVSPRSG